MGNTLIMLSGLPYSGKSTWAKKQGFPIVNRDSIRLALHGKRYVKKAESMITVIEDLMVHSLFLAGHITVIVDATHITKKRRDRWNGGPWDVIWYVMNTKMAVCLQRADKANDQEIKQVIIDMAQRTDIKSIHESISL